MKPNVSVMEAREILGSDALHLTDKEIEEIIATLDLLAKNSLEKAKIEIQMKKDAKDLAELIYDIYQEKRRNSDQKMV